MPTQTNDKKVDMSKGPEDIIKQLMKINILTLSPYQKGVNKKLEEMGANHAEEALAQGVPPTHIESNTQLNPKEILSNLLQTTQSGQQEQSKQQTTSQQKKQGNFWHTPFQVNQDTGEVTPESILGGLIQSTPQDTLARVQSQALMTKQKSTKGIYGFDPVTGKVTLQAQVPETADIRNMQSQTGIETLPQEQQVAAYGLARKIAGVRGAEKILPSIISNLKSGKTIDQVEDSMRMQGQSPEFSGALRNAAQSISVDKTESQRNVAFDALDDYVQKGDTEGAKDYLKRMSITSATADQQNQIMAKERTNDFLGEIRNDLTTLENNGIPTSFLRGSYENIISRVGQVKDPGMRKVATKIAIAVMNYRRSMTGVQFGMIENEEYKRLFPGINKVGDFNTANLDALEETLGGDLKKFYSLSMGKKNYDNLFGNENKQVGTQSQQGWTQDKESRYQELLRKRQGQ